MIAKPTLPEQALNQYIFSMLKIYHRNVPNCYGYGGVFYEKFYSQEPNDLLVVTKLRLQFVDPKTKVPTTSREFTFILGESLPGDITAALFHKLLKLQKT